MKQFERKIITFVFWGKMVSQRILLTCSPWNATCTPVTCLEGQILIVYFIAVNLGLHSSCKSNVPPLTDISVRYRELLDICSMPWSIFFLNIFVKWISHLWKLTRGRVIVVPSCSSQPSVCPRSFCLFLTFLFPAVTWGWRSAFA